MEITELFEKYKYIESDIEAFLPQDNGRQKVLFDAMNYSVKSGGKRLRPILMYESAALFGKENAAIKRFAASLEMIHSYSLIHDDLPAMDNDDLRRGLPTTHKKFGEAMAILAGDGLLNLSMEVVAEALIESPEDERIPKAIVILFRKAGIYGMIGGQSVDVESEKSGLRLSMEDLNFVYNLKTCALIESALEIGALLGGANTEQQRQMALIGNLIGKAFQIQDDILDIEGDEEILGKPVGSDIKNNKMTMAMYMGIDTAKEKVKSLTKEAIDILESMPGEKDSLKSIFSYLIERKN